MKQRLIFITLLLSVLFACKNDNQDDNSFDWENKGVKISREKVIAHFPKDSIDDTRMNEIVDSLNIGISAAMHLIGGPLEWQLFAYQPITYYFEPGRFVSRTDAKGDIYIPLFRIKNNQAPWLHETMHVLLRNKKGNWNEASQLKSFFSMPIWFNEGLAEYLSIKIEAIDSIKKFDLMRFGGYQNVDAACYKAIALDSDLISNMGESGVPIKLIRDRRNFAPPFYTCSCSFVKFLAENYGLDTILKANAEFENEHETIESLTGKKLQTLREEWVDTLKLTEVKN